MHLGLSGEKVAYLHHYLYTILFRHLEVEQHKVDGFNLLIRLRNRYCLFEHTLSSVDYLLAINAVRTLFMQT